jgi:phospholipase C
MEHRKKKVSLDIVMAFEHTLSPDLQPHFPVAALVESGSERSSSPSQAAPRDSSALPDSFPDQRLDRLYARYSNRTRGAELRPSPRSDMNMARGSKVLRGSWLFVIFVFALAIPLAVSQTGRGSSGNSQAPADFSAIQHFVFIIKENRSFDMYFGTFPGADGATSGTLSTGQVIPLQHAADAVSRNPGYKWLDGLLAMDYGKMDQFDLETSGSLNGDNLAYSQLYESDIPNYFAYARAFSLSDHMFASLHGPSYPAHLYMIAAQSGGAVGNFVGKQIWSCKAPADTTVEIVDSKGHVTNQFPCFDFPTLGDVLESANTSWTYYAHVDTNWNAYASINHVRNTPLWAEHIVSETQFLTDAQNGNLPAVSWLVPLSLYSEHASDIYSPTINSSCVGENWTVQQINAIMQGPDWPTTAIFVTWDDWGGWYEHLPPPTLDQYGFGPRVPLLIISPYAKPGYISHIPSEFSSFLKIVEERFGFLPLTARDAAANDMLDAFDFTQAPLPPLILQTRNCSPASNTDVSFPLQTVGSTSPAKTVTVSNYSRTDTLSLSSIVLSGDDFGQTNDCPATLAPTKFCTMNVVFNPTATGVRKETITVTDSDVTSPQIVNLSGTATEVTLSPDLLKFASTRIGRRTGPATATLTNLSATSSLTISSVVASGDYSQTNTCGSNVPPGGKCSISVTFSPIASGTRYGSITITDSDGGSPHVLNLTGVGRSIDVSTQKLSFGNQPVGIPSLPQSFTLTNNGSAPLTISAIQFNGTIYQTVGDYSQTNTCGGYVNPGATCAITVTFTPSTVGPLNGNLLIFHSDTGSSPQIIKLTGAGIANTVPAIAQPLVPATVPPGNPTFTLVVNGTGFVPSSTVLWNGVSLPTTFMSSKQLRATVNSSLVAAVGTASVAVSNPSPGGGSSSVVYFPINSPESSISLAASPVSTGHYPSWIAQGDFDHDGKVDFAVTNQNDDTSSILIGNGDGTFVPAAASPSTGQGPIYVATGDFNGDGKSDLAVANSTDNTVSILLGNGDDTFSPIAAAVQTNIEPIAIVAADFNKDGRLDLAVLSGAESSISIMLGNGDATFYPLASPVAGLGSISFAAGDVNADGNLDLVVANKTSSTVSVLTGKGDGTFKPGSSFATGTSPVSLALGDFNGDGKLDIAVANQSANTVSVLLGKGDGTFQPHVDYGVDSAPGCVTLGDMNGDGFLDLIVSNSGANTVSILPGKGNGTFLGQIEFPAGTAPTSVAVGDFNNNGRLDLSVVNPSLNSLTLMLQ